MASNRRIGLREIRKLGPGEVIWDGAIVGFGARRQKSDAVSYVLIYRTREGRQRWHTSDIMHELVDIFLGNCRDLVLTKKGLDMALYTPSTARSRRWPACCRRRSAPIRAARA
jgi:hypothetical protein